jgi:hypothetical protein
MPKRFKKEALQTVLIVGEGASDEAFLKHLKSLYISRTSGVRVKIINAQGGSPDNIVAYTARQIQNVSFNRTIVVMDTDVPWEQKTLNKAKRHKIKLIGSKPCIEGLMLEVLGNPVPDSSYDCKQQMQSLLTGNLTDPSSYQALFTNELIDEKSKLIPVLQEIIGCFKLRK